MSIHANGHPQGVRHTVATAGSVFILAGFAGIDRVLRGHRDGHLLQISTSSVVIGVVLIGHSFLSKYRVADDRSYDIGYDVGHEKGERDERERTRPRVVELIKPRRKPRN